MNKNYAKGRRLEYKILKQERDAGKIALRSAGSHSPIDIVSVDAKERVIRLIQCKAGEFSELERQKLLDEYSQLNGSFFVKFEVL